MSKYIVKFLDESRVFCRESDAIDYQIKLLSQAGVESTVEDSL